MPLTNSDKNYIQNIIQDYNLYDKNDEYIDLITCAIIMDILDAPKDEIIRYINEILHK